MSIQEKNRIRLIESNIESMIDEGKMKMQEAFDNNDQESYIAWSESVATCGKIFSHVKSLDSDSDVDCIEEIKLYLKNLTDDKRRNALDEINSTFSDEPLNETLDEYYVKEFLPKEWFAKPGRRTISEFNFFTARHFAE